LIAILSLVALFSAYLISIGISRSSADLSNEREDRSMSALRQAKTALISYAANEQWQLYKGQGTDQPGALPCPDRDDDGDADCVLPNTNSLIGRLPWKTVGVDDLRDASGERLWYALSANFRKASGTTVINSDTQACDTPACNPGQSHLTVSGTAPASNLVAVLFAPGPAILNQNRPSSAAAPEHNDPVNYLENFSLGDLVHFTFTTTALPSDTFNDRVLVITQAELMAAVEPVVAARIQRDIKPYLTAYLNTWGRYPFPAAALPPSPASSNYKGVAGQTWGLLPLTADTTFVNWQNPVSTIVTDSPPLSITSQDCSTSSSATLIDCTVAYNGTGTLSFSLAAVNVGKAFVRSHVIADLTVTASGSPLSPAPTLSSINNAPPPDASGNGYLSLSLNMPASAAPVRIQIPPPPLQPPPPVVVPTSWHNTMMTLATPSSAAGAGWLIANQWYKQLFYAVAPGLVPGGSGNCVPPNCLTVNNLTSPNNNKQAILVFAGRALNGTLRPSAAVANYLENANLSAATTYVYEHRAGVPTSINDRVVVVAP
jgi:hypothetical protein